MTSPRCRRRARRLLFPRRRGTAAAATGAAAVAPASSIFLVLLLLLPIGARGASFAAALPPPPPAAAPVLVVGATGGMGARALAGLLDAGLEPGRIRVMTRREDKAEELRQLGFGAAVANLDEDAADSTALASAVAGCAACYVHSTSSDTRELDTGEVKRAENLLSALVRDGGIRAVAFNSAAGESGHGVERIRQKHDVERVFLDKGGDGSVSFTSLRANLFMEELWKRYTRPSILKGTFPFSVPSDRPIYLTSVRDMGRLAGTVLLLQLQDQQTGGASSGHHRILNVAGDVMTPRAMADAFARAQGSPCRHSQSRVFALLARLFFRDLYEVIRFYRRTTETTDIDALKHEFPGLLTSFDAFLAETHWSDPDRTFEDLQKWPGGLLNGSRSAPASK